jgi:hypothetical protein
VDLQAFQGLRVLQDRQVFRVFRDLQKLAVTGRAFFWASGKTAVREMERVQV